MERLSAKELRKTLNWLLELATCPICLSTLQPATVQCVNGHPICVSCRKDLQHCPSCRDTFSNMRPTGFIQQVIQSLPHPCRFQDCTTFVKTNDDHEKYCGGKPEECKYCDWSGPGRQLLSHLQTEHKESLMFRELSVKLWGVPFNPKETCTIFFPMVVHDQFFWGEMKNDLLTEKLIAVVHVVTNGKTDLVFYAQVVLKLRKNRYRAGIIVNMDPEVDPYKDNCISIPTSILPKYTEENQLKYTFFIIRKKWKSLRNVVRAKMDYLKK